MYLVQRKEFLALPVGTIFSRFYPELIGADHEHNQISPRPWAGLCIKGETREAAFEYTDLVECLGHAHHPDDAEHQHVKLHQGHTGESIGTMQVDDLCTDAPDKDCLSLSAEGEDPRQLFAVWEIDEVDALLARLEGARAHLAIEKGLEI